MTTNLPIPRWDQPQPPNPYPERSSRDTGVRLHTEPAQLPDWMIADDLATSGPPRFAAESTSIGHSPVGCRRAPWESTGLYALGQVALAVAIALGALPAVTGLAICLLWTICGLTLIAAQTLTDRNAKQQ